MGLDRHTRIVRENQATCRLVHVLHVDGIVRWAGGHLGSRYALLAPAIIHKNMKVSYSTYYVASHRSTLNVTEYTSVGNSLGVL